MESNTNQNMTGGGATEVTGTAGATNQGDLAGQSVPTTSSATNVAEQSAPATGGQSLASELEKELETTPAVDTGPEPEPAPVKGKKKSGGGLIFAMVFVILLAAGGIGFGVWAMMDGNQQKEELNSQITTLKKQNSELMKKAEDTCATTEEITDNTANTGNTKDYIYVGEWGLKVKLPSELKQVVYEVRNGHTDGEADVAWQYQSGRSSLFVFGLLDEKVKNTNGYTIETANTCSSAWIVRIPKSQGFSNPDFSIGDYDFVFGGWQEGCYDENGNEQSDFAGKIIRNALMERENWSSI